MASDGPTDAAPPPSEPRESAFSLFAATAAAGLRPRSPPPSLVPRRAPPLSRRTSSSGGSFGSRRSSSSGGGGADQGRVDAAAATAAAPPPPTTTTPLPPPPPSRSRSTWPLLALNLAASVAIVFVNKQALKAFPRPVALSALHFFACGAAARLFCRGVCGQKQQPSLSPPPPSPLPRPRLAAFSALGALSIATLNLSLRANSVGVFQASKLLIAPAVAAIEAAVVGSDGKNNNGLSASSSPLLALSLAALSLGAALVGLSDRDTLSVQGLGAAAAAVLLSALQQVATAACQRDNPSLSSAALLARSAPIQAALLLALSPLLDPPLSSSSSSLSAQPPVPSWLWLAASAALATIVNLSQFACLAALRASTFAAAGNAKALAVFGAAAVLPPVPGAVREAAAAARVWGLGSVGAALCVAGAAGWTSGVAQQRRRQQWQKAGGAIADAVVRVELRRADGDEAAKKLA